MWPTHEYTHLPEAPLAIQGKVIVGVAWGGEFGIRGFKSSTPRSPRESVYGVYNGSRARATAGHNTWSAGSWKQGQRIHLADRHLRTDLNLLYWASGNPGPDMNGEVRKADNLFTMFGGCR